MLRLGTLEGLKSLIFFKFVPLLTVIMDRPSRSAVHRQTDRQTDRRTDRQTDRQTNRATITLSLDKKCCKVSYVVEHS